MITKKTKADAKVVDFKVVEGQGKVQILDYLGEKNPPHISLAAPVVVPAGMETDLHVHTGDSEIYYIVSGRASYTDGESTVTLEPGDLTVAYDGDAHAIKALGDEDLVFFAVISTND